MHLTGHFKSYFLRGLAVLLPTILTIWIFIWGYNFIQDNISVHINWGLVWLTMKLKGLDWDNEAVRQVWAGFWVDGWGSVAGFIIALIVVCIVGRYIEKLIMNAPFLRRVYPYIKQITDFLLVRNKKEQLFLRVVGVQYPRKDIWSIGMVTGEGLPRLVNNFKKDFLTVLIPTSPTPFTGFVIMVPKEETVELDITIEEAMRFTISAGVITPATKLEDLEKYRAELPAESNNADEQLDVRGDQAEDSDSSAG